MARVIYYQPWFGVRYVHGLQATVDPTTKPTVHLTRTCGASALSSIWSGNGNESTFFPHSIAQAILLCILACGQLGEAEFNLGPNLVSDSAL